LTAAKSKIKTRAFPFLLLQKQKLRSYMGQITLYEAETKKIPAVKKLGMAEKRGPGWK